MFQVHLHLVWSLEKWVHKLPEKKRTILSQLRFASYGMLINCPQLLQMMDELTLAVSVENRTLLVPLSKMIVLDVFNRDVVCPFTDIPGDVSCHVLPDPDGRDAKIGVPIRHFEARSVTSNTFDRPYDSLTCEFRVINPSKRHLSFADILGNNRQAEQS